jgi:hypothetical protein
MTYQIAPIAEEHTAGLAMRIGWGIVRKTFLWLGFLLALGVPSQLAAKNLRTFPDPRAATSPTQPSGAEDFIKRKIDSIRDKLGTLENELREQSTELKNGLASQERRLDLQDKRLDTFSSVAALTQIDSGLSQQYLGL